MSDDKLAEELEQRVLELFEMPEEEREQAVAEFCKAHPEHEERLRRVYSWLGENQKGLAFTEEAAALEEERLGPAHHDVLLLQIERAVQLGNLMRHVEAEKPSRQDPVGSR